MAGLLTAILIGYIGPVKGYFDQRAELAQERSRLHALEAQRQEYTEQLAIAGRTDVLRVRAREAGLVMPGERAFWVRGDLDPPTAEPEDDSGGGGPFDWLTKRF
ncbi:MAG: septum formation initiator family protein [Thermoleophilia bacterium]